MSNPQTLNFLEIDFNLQRFFALQFARLEFQLKPHSSHSLGSRKPDLEQQEATLDKAFNDLMTYASEPTEPSTEDLKPSLKYPALR